MTTKADKPKKELEFIYEKAGHSEVVYNVDQEYITTTADKIRICLHNHMKNLGKRRAWTTPLGIFLTILTTFVTTNFKDAFLSAETWQAVFIISALLSALWLSWSLIQMPKSENEEDIIKALKKQSPNESSNSLPQQADQSTES